MSYFFAARICLTREKRKQNRLALCNSIEAFWASIDSYCLKISRVQQAEQSAKLFKRFPGRIAKTVMGTYKLLQLEKSIMYDLLND